MLSAQASRLNVPRGTLCLTFDDGPGPDTLRIARFLAGCGIRATFFVVGRCAERDGHTVRAIRELGHGVGNHSFNHRPLAALAWAGKDVVSEIADTDRLIAGAIGDGPFLLRPPYGNWSSGVAEALNDSETTRKYVGPVMWNIDGADFALGTRRGDEIWTLERCAAGYFHLIDAHGGGVVLLHDGGKKADPPSTGGGTFELVERLVKGLRARFEFKALDEVLRAA